MNNSELNQVNTLFQAILDIAQKCVQSNYNDGQAVGLRDLVLTRSWSNDADPVLLAKIKVALCETPAEVVSRGIAAITPELTEDEKREAFKTLFGLDGKSEKKTVAAVVAVSKEDAKIPTEPQISEAEALLIELRSKAPSALKATAKTKLALACAECGLAFDSENKEEMADLLLAYFKENPL